MRKKYETELAKSTKKLQEQLEGIYAELDLIEKRQFETLSYRPRREMFHYPLGAATALMFVYHFIMFLMTLVRAKAVRHA